MGRRDPRFNHEARQEAKRLYESGLTERQIGERMGKSKTTVRRYLDDERVARRPVGPKRLGESASETP